MTREAEAIIARLICRQEKGGCGKPITIISDPPAKARGPRQKRMAAVHSDEQNGHALPVQVTMAVIYKLRGALEDRCASQRENFV
jgi:hypothetical protein